MPQLFLLPLTLYNLSQSSTSTALPPNKHLSGRYYYLIHPSPTAASSRPLKISAVLELVRSGSCADGGNQRRPLLATGTRDLY